MGLHLEPHHPRIAGLATGHKHHSSRHSTGGMAGLGCCSSAAVHPIALDESNEPIIVTFSWLGATKRPYSKYVQLWQSLGFRHVLAARSRVSSALVPPAGMRRARKLTRKLIQMAQQRPNAPILVHLFSGGGFIYMGCVCKLLAEWAPTTPAAADVRSRIRGVIFDSSPANVTADVFSRALVAAALARPAEGIEVSAGWLVKPTTAVIERVLEIPTYKKQLRAMEQSWLQHAPPCPKLFLYSDADALIQPAAVESFMEQLGRAGSETFRHKWGDSEHVCHFRQYPEEYTQQLVQFVRRVLPEQEVLTEQQAVPQQQQVLPEQQQQLLLQQE